jgi:hypothetical protein
MADRHLLIGRTVTYPSARIRPTSATYLSVIGPRPSSPPRIVPARRDSSSGLGGTGGTGGRRRSAGFAARPPSRAGAAVRRPTPRGAPSPPVPPVPPRSQGPLAVPRSLEDGHKTKRPPARSGVGGRGVEAGDVVLSHSVSRAVPSALRGLTTVFGMGTGVSLAL